MNEQNSLDLFEQEKKYVKGRHLVTIFHNEQNLYSVIRIRVDETNHDYDDKEAVITGYLPKMNEEETYTYYGDFKEHPRFGLQLQATSFRKEMPQTKQGVVAYLSSNLFKGIGEKTAENIVDTLGEEAISKIMNQPSILDTVPKLAADKAKILYDTLMKNQGLEQAMVSLNQYGFGPQLSMKIYQVYKENTLEVVQTNPYKLVEDIEGIGFGKADDLGSQIGITGNHPDRLKAGCLYILELSSNQEGHVYLQAEYLLEKVKVLLEENQKEEIEFSQIAEQIIQLEEEGKIIVEDKKIYLPSLFFSEKGLVRNIKRVMEQSEYKDQFPESEFLLALGNLEDRIGVQYAPSQREAIQTALMSPMLILTGGPGTGKTTVIKGIVELYGELHGCSLDPNDYKNDEPYPFILAAPTGRAAKRMAESTGLPAVTIHRLLGWNGTGTFERDEDHPLEGKILIVDETSMVDIWLAHQLFKALPEHIQVIIVGDEDQLPSVGPGQVLKDLLDSACIPTVKLKDIYRQAEGSSIIELAHEMKKGQLPANLLVPQGDRSFIKCSSSQIPQAIEKIVLNAKNKGFAPMDIQVLAPMYRGPAGIDRLNAILQESLNPNPDGTRKELKFGDVTYRIGDKVLQLVNQPESNVFNGDMGEIVSIFYAKENTEKQDMVIVSFDGIEATYTRQDLNQITLAYCCSVHKSQGSEFPIVIMPIVKSYYRMLRRNLIYTGITRSKQFLILCGEVEAIELGVSRNDELNRQTTLKEKIKEAFADVYQPDETKEMTSENSFDLLYEGKINQIDPMIGMENITPYDFMETSEV
ncbi:ATP-dependent RecD-like DNA helicase [Cytobacillus oceanisediminis]|uniref:ATP-dependent RecD2 DNA helicase n=1 Tax=Niallia alba TaxID=2729105 RepID=A0A7Y0PPK2_9BACI|nr:MULTISPECIES: ATP-dependent RecD-like DNA helicase [Bacillaceae]MBQ6447942.1 ATP-dependent RecD-like DNA helicase [Bacillus sp. (in: firmicutes)]MBZ9535365.1 ATP-dependent RecD-like DNA helicase [Cytobacillus oceanisediminis]NMO78574.1 ATP-dependent RecD-like DNA helicase [Niallia alba]